MADKVLQDPSRRRLFEKDDIFSLIAEPNIEIKNSPETTDGCQSDEEVQKSPKVRCMKITKKTIKKDKNY